MPYSRITHTRNGAEAIRYAISGSGHTHGKDRYLLIGSVGFAQDNRIDQPPESWDRLPYQDQFERLWGQASSRNKTQIRRGVLSFSDKELPPEDPASPEKALQICIQMMRDYYDGFPALIVVQNDGKGGKIHAHVLIANVSMLTGKGFSDKQTKYWYLENACDETCRRFINLDFGPDYAADKVTQSERRKREENERTKEDNKALPPDQQKPLHFIWKDELKQRISAAMEEATDRDDYLDRLADHGVTGTYRYSKAKGNYILYELSEDAFPDGEKVPQNRKSKSYKLGENYDIGKLDDELERKAKERAEQEQQETVQRAVPEAPVADVPAVPVPAPTPKQAPKKEAPKAVPAPPEKTPAQLDQERREQEEKARQDAEIARQMEEARKFYRWCEGHGLDPDKFAEDGDYYRIAKRRYDKYQQEQARKDADQSGNNPYSMLRTRPAAESPAPAHQEQAPAPQRKPQQRPPEIQSMIDSLQEDARQVREAGQEDGQGYKKP